MTLSSVVSTSQLGTSLGETQPKRPRGMYYALPAMVYAIGAVCVIYHGVGYLELFILMKGQCEGLGDEISEKVEHPRLSVSKHYQSLNLGDYKHVYYCVIMNKTLNVMLLLLIGVAGVAKAQSSESTSDSTHFVEQTTSQNYDSLLNEITQLKSRVNLAEEERMQENIWKRKKYLKFGTMFPSVKYIEGNGYLSWETDFAFMLQQGKTAYLHTKPNRGMVKIGVDWGLIGVNYEKLKFKNPVKVRSNPNKFGTPADDKSLDLGMHKIECAPHIGPSISVNPWNHLIVSAYFHVMPTASLILENDNLSYGFGCVMAAGVSVAHKGISLGFEGAWSTIKYIQTEIDNDEDSYEYDDDFNISSIFNTEKFKLKTSCPRIYLSIRW